MKTETRILAESIQKITSQSLVYINWIARQYVDAGLHKDVKSALKYMLSAK